MEDSASGGRLDVVSTPGLNTKPWLEGLRATWLGEAMESPWSHNDRAMAQWQRMVGLGANPELHGGAVASQRLGHGVLG